mmetsp:Transcript_33996/g.54482  ORF Transcript_33996/g.54482 Transcript_33996/m.54482 type:complete len:270 (+) Transcript_33996:266-1075(+)
MHGGRTGLSMQSRSFHLRLIRVARLRRLLTLIQLRLLLRIRSILLLMHSTLIAIIRSITIPLVHSTSIISSSTSLIHSTSIAIIIVSSVHLVIPVIITHIVVLSISSSQIALISTTSSWTTHALLLIVHIVVHSITAHISTVIHSALHTVHILVARTSSTTSFIRQIIAITNGASIVSSFGRRLLLLAQQDLLLHLGIMMEMRGKCAFVGDSSSNIRTLRSLSLRREHHQCCLSLLYIIGRRAQPFMTWIVLILRNIAFFVVHIQLILR